MTQHDLIICNEITCNLVVDIAITFDIVDILGQKINGINDNKTIYIDGYTQPMSNINIMNEENSTSIGFGQSDINGRFFIPVKVYDTDITHILTITCILMKQQL